MAGVVAPTLWPALQDLYPGPTPCYAAVPSGLVWSVVSLIGACVALGVVSSLLTPAPARRRALRAWLVPVLGLYLMFGYALWFSPVVLDIPICFQN